MKKVQLFPVSRRRNIKRFLEQMDNRFFHNAATILENVDSWDRPRYLSALHEKYEDELSEARYAVLPEKDVGYTDQCTDKLNKIQEILDDE